MKTIKRTEAAEILDEVRELLAIRSTPENIEQVLYRHYGIEPLKSCDGSAHSNAHIDNCARCSPRWGWIGSRIKIT